MLQVNAPPARAISNVVFLTNKNSTAHEMSCNINLHIKHKFTCFYTVLIWHLRNRNPRWSPAVFLPPHQFPSRNKWIYIFGLHVLHSSAKKEKDHLLLSSSLGCFFCLGPTVWNSLPLSLWAFLTFECLKWGLITCVFEKYPAQSRVLFHSSLSLSAMHLNPVFVMVLSVCWLLCCWYG